MVIYKDKKKKQETLKNIRKRKKFPGKGGKRFREGRQRRKGAGAEGAKKKCLPHETRHGFSPQLCHSDINFLIFNMKSKVAVAAGKTLVRKFFYFSLRFLICTAPRRGRLLRAA